MMLHSETSKSELDMPILCIDLDVMESNIGKDGQFHAPIRQTMATVSEMS